MKYILTFMKYILTFMKYILTFMKYILTFIPVSCIWKLHQSQYCMQKLSHNKYI